MSNIDPGPTDDHYMYCPQVTGITICGIQMLSSVRVLTWEPLTGMLLANPPNDTSLLWNITLAAEKVAVCASGIDARVVHRDSRRGSITIPVRTSNIATVRTLLVIAERALVFLGVARRRVS